MRLKAAAAFYAASAGRTGRRGARGSRATVELLDVSGAYVKVHVSTARRESDSL